MSTGFASDVTKAVLVLVFRCSVRVVMTYDVILLIKNALSEKYPVLRHENTDENTIAQSPYC